MDAITTTMLLPETGWAWRAASTTPADAARTADRPGLRPRSEVHALGN